MDYLKNNLFKIIITTVFFLFPLYTFAEFTPQNLDVPISKDGVISAFSVPCQATSTNATALLLVSTPQETMYNPFIGSIYGYMRRPCINGVANFDSYNLKAYLEQEGDYSKWSKYFFMPFNLVVKDSTGVYSSDDSYRQVINLAGSQNDYNFNVYRIENQYYKTLGYGTTYTYDEVNNWFDYISATRQVPPQNSSVLFLPGLQASRLYLDKVACTVDCTDQLWEPNGNSDVEDLYLDTDGNSLNKAIYTKDIIDETNTPLSTGPLGINIYKSFIEMMNQMVENREIRQWKAFPYDWREDVFDVVNKGAKTKDGQVSLIQTVRDLALKSRNGKVTIIAHSNGGLLAKALLYKLKENYDYDTLLDKIDRVVFVAVPQVGTASAVPAMLHGYGQDILAGLIVDAEYPRELGRNMRSAYSLLPTKKYMESITTPPVVFDNTIDFEITKKYKEKYGDNIDTFAELQDFLVGDDFVPTPTFANILTPTKLNTNMLTNAETVHSKLDNFVFPSHIKVTEVSGWGLKTIASFKYQAKKPCPTNKESLCINGYFLDQRPIMTIDGDGTVVSPSALFSNGEEWWVNFDKYNRFKTLFTKRDHKNILEVSDLLTNIRSLLKEESLVENTIISKTKPIDIENRMQLSVHSPVNIGVYDKDGNFTGKVCLDNVCYIEEGIPNSSYLEFGEGKYVDIKETDYNKTILTGYDTGTFTYEIEKTKPDGTSTTTSFYDIPTTALMKAEITETNSNPVLKIDTNGDGNFDMEIGNQKEFDPIISLEIIKKTVEGLDLNEGRKNSFIKRVDNLIKLIGKGKIDRVKLRAENFTKILQKRIDRKDPKKLQQGRLTKADAEILLKMFEELLINLNK